ncbi:MAG: hypothetical protein DMG00_25250 [Acidobacteria bacterium]|nr:MAG: hypothetical protein DMG00_25250 [Acidobacteriota bacterium]
MRRFVITALAVLCPALAGAQAVKGSLVGNVTDTSGAVLPGVTVTITEVNTNISYSTTTNESGYYTFSNLKDGTYRVTSELSGFKRFVREGVEVPVNATVRVDCRMDVGALEESVTVVGASPLLQTDRADTGRIIESVHLQEVPLGFNRNFQGMLVTVPGATRPFRPHSEFFNAQDSLSTNVNGQSRLANNVQIEGIDDNHRTGLLTTLIPSAEAIETVNVTTSMYDAEFGRAGGATMSREARSPSATTRRRTRPATSRTRTRRPTTSRPASRSAARFSATSCSSSATTATSRTTPAGRRARSSRRRRFGTATSRRHRRRSTIHRPAAPTVPGARRSRTTSSLPIASARSRKRFWRTCPRRTSMRRRARSISSRTTSAPS